MKAINFTKKDISPMLLLYFSELCLLSTIGDLKTRARYTKKWTEVIEKIQPMVDENHSIVMFLDYCFNKSAIPESELDETKILLFLMIDILENLSKKEVKDALMSISPIVFKYGEAKRQEILEKAKEMKEKKAKKGAKK